MSDFQILYLAWRRIGCGVKQAAAKARAGKHPTNDDRLCRVINSPEFRAKAGKQLDSIMNARKHFGDDWMTATGRKS